MKLLHENWKKYLDELKDFDFSTFELKEELNQNIWDGEELREEIAEKLMEITNDFWENLDLKDVEIVDIIVTGSIANYNWTDMSDIDLHILVNFKDVDENTELVDGYFRYLRANWNKVHNIEIKGHEVEMYVQEADEPHASTGVYSLSNGEWVKKPTYKEITIDENTIAQKAQALMDLIDGVEKEYEAGLYEEAHEETMRLGEKIRNFRKSGLETGGEYSPENLAFKVLRRNGYLGKLSSLKTDSYDKTMSLNGHEKQAQIKLTLK